MKDLTFQSALSLAAAIRSKQVSSLEVIDAHLVQIERANGALNAVVHVMAENARNEARAADQAIARGDALGPFHGVPMSVKDAWEVAGVPSTGGTLGRAGYLPQRDATVIARMRAAGAIPIAMTNLPEMSFAFESDNLVHGRSENPYAIGRTPGGSGGGGGAAIAAGMSPIEIGADLGGSIRLPSHFSGIAGIRPTSGRVPLTGYFPPCIGWTRPLTAAGPMARYVDDLIASLPVVSGSDWIDPYVVDMPLGKPEQIAITGMRVAMHTHNGILPARADVADTVKSAAKQLSDAGAIVDEVKPTGIEGTFEIFLGMSTSDGGDGLRALLAMAGTKHISPLIEGFLALANDHKPAGFLHQMLAQADMCRSAMLGFFRNYDLILCPVNAFPAMEHGATGQNFPAFSYTMAFNLTGWPGAVVRCGTSQEGLPIAVQAVAHPWREDVALVAVRYLETALGGYQRPAAAASA